MTMKCPFRTTITTEQLYSPNGSVTTTEFADCLKNECPYWGQKVHRFNDATLKWETVIEPICRGCNVAERTTN